MEPDKALHPPRVGNLRHAGMVKSQPMKCMSRNQPHTIPKRIRSSCRGLAWLGGILTALCLSPQPCEAYGTDVHFNLTYVLCRNAGLGWQDSLWIAAADESMDHNDCTTAYGDDGFTQTVTSGVWDINGEYWHAFTDKTIKPNTDTLLTHAQYSDPAAARLSVESRRNLLWAQVQLALSKTSPSSRDTIIGSDISMGQFLHFEQDYYAHRQMTGYMDDKTWLPYGPYAGHYVDGHKPDYVVAREDLAVKMAENSYPYIITFAQSISTKHPAPLTHLLATSLIKALGNSYKVNTFGITPPTQSEVISALAPVIHTGAIPIFTNKMYNLPYDHPDTLLSEVKSRFGEQIP